jgi:hypothetical protein
MVKYFTYLDNLRESGVTNMLGAVPYLLEAFEELDRKEAITVLQMWCDSK